MKVIERFFQYLYFKGIKPTRFEKDVGFSNGYLGTQLKRRGNLGEDTILTILKNCEDLSLEWLITGNGKMLRVNDWMPDEPKIDAIREILELRKTNEALFQENSLKMEMISLQRDTIQRLKYEKSLLEKELKDTKAARNKL